MLTQVNILFGTDQRTILIIGPTPFGRLPNAGRKIASSVNSYNHVTEAIVITSQKMLLKSGQFFYKD